MQVSVPNDNGVLDEGHRETLACFGRAHAKITFALCEDGQFRYGLSMTYSYGGFSMPISGSFQGFPSIEAARTAAIKAMLCRWQSPFPSDPASVREELRRLREQLEARLQQPSLF